MSADCTLLRATLAGLKAEELDAIFALLSAASSLGSSATPAQTPAFTLPQNATLRASPHDRAVHAMGE